jgi:hypothetical protein
MTTEKPGADAPLQFDRVQTGSTEAGHTAAARGVVCQSCGAAIRTTYFSLGEASICGLCRANFEESVERSRSWPAFFKASLYGLVAAILGAVIYYGVIAITDYEIGLVAILIGYMVGFAIRKGALGFGSLRYQILALALTYFAVSLAYVPLAFQAARGEGPEDPTVVHANLDTPAPPEPGATAEITAVKVPLGDDTNAEAKPVTGRQAFKALGALAVLFLGLPIIAIVYSMPSGLISALIIGFGLRQAWRMTAEIPLEVTGPYRVSTPTSA